MESDVFIGERVPFSKGCLVWNVPPPRQRTALRLFFSQESNTRRFGLDETLGDDRILACILACQEDEETSVGLLSADLGLRLKCIGKGVQCFDPKTYFIPLPREDSTSERERKLKSELEAKERELLALRERLPKLSLTFSDSSVSQDRSLRNLVGYSEQDISNACECLGKRFAVATDMLPGVMGESDFSQRFVNNYNKVLSSYFRQVEDYLRNAHLPSGAGRLFRTIEVELLLQNTGSAVGKDIDIFVSVQSSSLLLIKSEVPKQYCPPPPPGGTALSMVRRSIPERIDPEYDLPDLNFHSSGPTIEDRVTRVQYWEESLKHGEQVKLKSFYIEVIGDMPSDIIQLAYELAVENYPERVRGSLEIRYSLEPVEFDPLVLLGFEEP